jgi:hypothetical protein
MLHFDNKGHLKPHGTITSTIEEFKKILVDDIKSETRQTNYEKYIRYSNDLKKLSGGDNIRQWINGSFVTQKANPQDIDLVTFLNQTQIRRLGKHINRFNVEGSSPMYGVDAYIVEIHPPDSRFYSHTQGNTAYWLEIFSSTKVNRRGMKYKKGFIEIIY